MSGPGGMHSCGRNSHLSARGACSPVLRRATPTAFVLSRCRASVIQKTNGKPGVDARLIIMTNKIFRALSVSPEAAILCPRCRSTDVAEQDLGRKAGATIGSIAGAAGGATGVFSGAQAGATAGFFAGPVGLGIGAVVGAILGGLCGGVAGCAVGAACGDAVDETILGSHRCLDCDHTFTPSAG